MIRYTSGNYYQINRGDGSSQTLDALNKVIGLGFFQGNGYNLGAAFDYRLSSKKNHFYYRLGLTFRNVYVDKISYTDSPNVDVSESTFAYAFKSKNIDLSLLNGFGYSLSVSRINIKAFAAIEIKKMYFNGEYLYLHTYNFQTSQHIDHDPSTLSDFKKGDWYFLPTINVSVGYSL